MQALDLGVDRAERARSREDLLRAVGVAPPEQDLSEPSVGVGVARVDARRLEQCLLGSEEVTSDEPCASRDDHRVDVFGLRPEKDPNDLERLTGSLRFEELGSEGASVFALGIQSKAEQPRIQVTGGHAPPSYQRRPRTQRN